MIYNLTLQVENPLIKSWKSWMKSVLIPELSPYVDGATPTLYRVVLSDESDTQTYAFQVHFKVPAHLDTFIQECAPKIEALLHREFGSGVMRFATVLEPQSIEA